MRRITLILSDLYLPQEAGRGASIPAALDLPNLDWLLRFAGSVERIGDWRSWLSAELGVFDLTRISVAEACAKGSLPASLASNAWIATPVFLEARIDHVRLADRGLLRLDAGERETWKREFALAFGPGFALHDAGERGFLLSGAAPIQVASVDPSRLLDADIGQALPTGPSAGELRRLGTEIEMWLHGAPANLAREQRRQRRVSALWLWGGGLRNGPGESVAVASAPPHATAAVHGGDPFIRALAGATASAAPPDFAALDARSDHVVVELAPMSGPKHESLSALDANWFAPVREALASGALSSADLIANDRRFRITARPGWRFWRRRFSWLRQLAR